MTKIFRSSTFWVGILLPTLKLVLDAIGVHVPWEVVMTSGAAYGVKEAASKINTGRT